MSIIITNYQVAMKTMQVFCVLLMCLPACSAPRACPTIRKNPVPFMVSVQVREKHICSASVVVVDGIAIAITTAICIRNVYYEQPNTPGDWTVLTGPRDKTQTDSYQKRYLIFRYTLHPKFDYYNYKSYRHYNIAIIFLKGLVEFDQNFQPIALPLPTEKRFLFETIDHFHWYHQDSGERILIKSSVSANYNCDKSYNVLTDTYFCAYIELLPDSLHNSCIVFNFGIGNPAVYNNTIVGLQIFSGCVDSLKHFVDVSFFRNWFSDEILDTNLHEKIEVVYPALPGSVPYILSVQLNDRHICSATLIQFENVLVAITTATCDEIIKLKYDPEKDKLSLVAGIIDMQEELKIQQSVEVSKITVHPQYTKRKRNYNNIAVLFLNVPFEITDYVNPISLPTFPVSKAGFDVVQISGWANSHFSTSYLHTTKQYASWKCKHFVFQGHTFCSESITYLIWGHSDVGNPAVVDGVLVGMAIYSSDEYYSDVTLFLDWLRDTILA